tara:strand:- start:359 stop:691 length:333 start_codon:yes stop_codon:yes gene_type:complete
VDALKVGVSKVASSDPPEKPWSSLSKIAAGLVMGALNVLLPGLLNAHKIPLLLRSLLDHPVGGVVPEAVEKSSLISTCEKPAVEKRNNKAGASQHSRYLRITSNLGLSKY